MECAACRDSILLMSDRAVRNRQSHIKSPGYPPGGSGGSITPLWSEMMS